MDIVLLLVGIAIGVVLTAIVFRSLDTSDREALRVEMGETFQARAEAEQSRIVRAYEAQIHKLEDQYRDAIGHARRQSVDQSRAVLKGKMAEQMAPLLPGFDYWPADARFLGDPVDYVVFDGYSACKERRNDGQDIEVVILDIKQGKSVLTREQRRIADAVAAGRVRFEVVRVFADGTIRSRVWQALDAGTIAEGEEDV